MLINLDKHQILYYLEGCARTSYFRDIAQECWCNMIKLYSEMPQDMRDYIYARARRDIAPFFQPHHFNHPSLDGLRPAGAEDFDQFLACFDKDNRYKVTTEKGGKMDSMEAYLYRGRYYTNHVLYYDSKHVTKVEKI